MAEDYRSKGKNDLSLQKRIVRFFVDHAKLERCGQGTISVTCPALWEMENEEFERTFGVELK